MSKIYSRPRIKLPRIFISNFKNKKSGKNKKIFKVLIVVIIAFSTVKFVLDAILPLFDELCEEKAKSIATIISNEQATEAMKNHTYNDFFDIEKDNDGNIVMIKSNIATINDVISDVALKIQEEIDKSEKDKVKMALGTFTGFKLLSGKGPDIPIKISSLGTVKTDLRSEFTEQGINQTLHRIYLQVDCEISVLTPYNKIKSEVSNQVLLAENVIVGRIPSTYYNFKDLKTDNVLDTLE